MKTRLKIVKERIRNAAVLSGRDPESIRLVAVSKTKPAEVIMEAINAGVTILGENYIQETLQKLKTKELDTGLPSPVSWHFIGHLQTNKAKYAVKIFDLIHTVDSLKLAKELDKQAKKIGKVQQILLQVNIGMEPSKSGAAAEDVKSLIREIISCKNLSVKGLMVIPPFFNDPEKVRPYFSALRDLADQIKNDKLLMSAPNIAMDELSMGMTADFEIAIEEGATLVRIGTAIFGKRA